MQPQVPPAVQQGAMNIPGAEDTTPEFPVSGPKPVNGINASFNQRLQAFMEAVKQAGGDVSVYAGPRTAADQAILFKQALAKHGSVAEARKHVAPPGKSNHDPHSGLKYGMGDGALGVDIRGDLHIAHRLAPHFGLAFPSQKQPWHIEPAGLKGG